MTGFWLVSYIVLWLIVIVGGFTIIALAREIEVLHKHIDSLRRYTSRMGGED
jgi:hypothetical protein